jgi:HK97 family phage portal protein
MPLFRRNKVQTRDPDQFPPWTPLWNQNLTGVAVTDVTALGIVTLWRCVELISSTIAGLSVHVYRDDERIETPAIIIQPNPTENRIDTYSALLTSMLLRGNGYGRLGDFDRFGHPRQLVVLDPDAVQVKLSATTGAITYQVGDQTYTAAEVLHLRGFMRPGHIVGQGVLDSQKHALGLAIAEHEYTERTFSEGSIPSGIIKTETDLSPEAATELKKAWVQAHGGLNRTPAVLSGGLDYKAIQLSNSDLELLEARKWSATQIAALFGVPAHLAGAPSSDSLTYSTVQEDSRAFVRFGLRPNIIRLEQALSTVLPRGQSASINIDSFLRADTLTRYQAHQIALTAGWVTVDEVRKMEGLPT